MKPDHNPDINASIIPEEIADFVGAKFKGLFYKQFKTKGEPNMFFDYNRDTGTCKTYAGNSIRICTHNNAGQVID